MDTTSEKILQKNREKKEDRILFELIEKALQKRQQTVVRNFKKKHKQLNQWMQANGHQLAQVQDQLTRTLLSGGLAAVMLAGVMVSATPTSLAALAGRTSHGPPAQTVVNDTKSPSFSFDSFKNDLMNALGRYKAGPSEQVEEDISKMVTQVTSVPAKATLDGHKMNKIYGFFGKEQHLYRYPGDSLTDHAKTEEDKDLYLPSGIAPGLGAWGYFAPSKVAFTEKDEQRERYYIAAQTFLFPDYYTDRSVREWLKFRKIIVYNPNNNKAVVAVIGDSGPATWTGKTYGGSPEVMHHLQMVDGKQKSEAVVLFVDDPNDQIPLGPVDTTPKNAL